jgi:PAS domain S-box-containing protein
MGVDFKRIILLVEDEVIIALSKQKDLEKYGYNVLIANTGEKAVVLSKNNNKIDLILMDIDLGKGIDGTEAAELILKDREIPIVFMSSHTESEVVEKTEKITSYGYVVKSSSITVIDASIKMAFRLFDATNIIEKHRQHLNITLNSIGDAVIVTDIWGDVLSLNPVAEALTGWKSELVLGKPLPEVFNIINAGNRKLVDNPVNKVLETGQIIGLSNHTVLIAKDGNEYKIADSAAPIKDFHGLITGVVLVFRDVTEEYKLKEDLLQSEKQYRLLFESMIEGMCLHEIVYNDSGKAINYRILDANPKYEKILGLDKNDVVGKLASDIYHTDEAPYLDIYARVAETGEPDQFEVFFPPMKKHFLISIFSPDKGKFATIFEDITKSKHLESSIKTEAHSV